MAYPNYVFSIFAFLGFLLCCIPFPWHLEAWNTGTCLYMAWTALACLNQFINSIVWNGNAINWAPVWCDISARIIVGTAVAIPAASLCINRRLYHIASVRSVTVTKAEKRRAILVDLAIGLGLPIMEMILQYIPQGHRFNIFEDVGCYPFTYNTPVGIALVEIPPVLIGCVSFVYCALSIRAFIKCNAQFKELLSAHNNLSSNRYLRLICLASIEMLFTVPLGIYSIWANSTAGRISPWKGWADTHYGFSRVDQIPAILWRFNKETRVALEVTRWFVVMCALIFFAFFGFAEEARKNYRSAVQSVAKRVGYTTSSFGSGMFSSTGTKTKGLDMSGTTGSIPVFVQKHTLRTKDSLDSISDMSLSFKDVGGLLDEKEKPVVSEINYDTISLPDAGGVLADYKVEPYSPAPSSGSSSSSSLSSPRDGSQTSLPEVAVTRPDSECIEISSVRRMSIVGIRHSVSVPDPAFNRSSPPNHPTDSPIPAYNKNAHDTV